MSSDTVTSRRRRQLRRLPAARRCLPALLLPALLLATLAGAPGTAAAATPLTWSGTVSGSCKYKITIDTEAKTFKGEVNSCIEGTIGVKLSGKYKGSYVSLTKVEGQIKFEGHQLSLEESLDWGFDVPIELDQFSLETLLTAIAAGTQQPQAAQAAIDSLLAKAVTELGGMALEKLAEEVGGTALRSAAETQEKLEDGGHGYCDDATELDPFCEEGEVKTASVGSEGLLSETEADEAALCPISLFQKSVVFDCLPTFVMGDLDTGNKPLVILPGGMLIALPIGGESLLSLTTTPTISSKRAIVSLGGVLVGYNLKLKAPDLGLAAGAVDMAGALDLEGEQVKAGSVDIEEAIGALPGELFDNPYYKGFEKVAKAVNMPNPLPETGSFSTPLAVAASSIEVGPGKGFVLGSSSTLTTSGRGGRGGTPQDAVGGLPGGEAPGGLGGTLAGAKDGYGGSHGGYGGIVESLEGVSNWASWHEVGGRGDTFDSPFAPGEPGAGGSGNYRDSVVFGADGGGAVRINAPKATVEIDGEVDASGGEVGVGEDGGAYAGGEGGGAGGSVYVTAKSLAGGGTIDADGGGYPAENDNSDGGAGGGGRIALVYGADGAWHGDAHAHGGVDHHFLGIGGGEPFFVGTGGAGTVFSREVAFEESSVKEGKGEYPEGTLTIDGGLPPGYYPPPDGTPIEDAWGDPQRKLVLTGEARGYGHHPDFGAIEVLDGSDLSGLIGSQNLEVSAGTLKVDASSRIDMTGRGYAGGHSGESYDAPGDADGGETAPGVRPATRDFGGSHGGAGGRRPEGAGYQHPENGDVPGETYDDPLEPSLPGGGGAGEYDVGRGTPGGGVLDVDADTLLLEGELSANGEDGAGPTAIQPAWFNQEDGAGAGGSILVRAGRLGGSGTVRADGGDACVGDVPPLLPGVGGCETLGGGGGGGGRVAVYATDCGWTGVLSAAGGVDQLAADEAERNPDDPGRIEDAALSRGEDGSTYFSDPGGSCSDESPPAGGGGGGGQAGGGQDGGQTGGPASSPAQGSPSPPPPAASPLPAKRHKPLRCRRGSRRTTVKGKARCVKVKHKHRAKKKHRPQGR